MSDRKCHSILGWYHISPSWYPALIHRIEQALSQRALDRDPKVVLGPQPTALELLEGKPVPNLRVILLYPAQWGDEASPVVIRKHGFPGDLPWS